MRLSPRRSIAPTTRALVALLLSASLLHGCTGSPSPAPPTTEAVTQSAAPSHEQPAPDRTLRGRNGVLEFPTVNLSDARPVTYEATTQVGPPKPGEEDRAVLALGDDGRTLVRVGEPRDPSRPKAATNDRVGLLNSDGSVTLFEDTSGVQSDGKPRSAYAGDINDEWAVWMETSSTDMYYSSWRLFAQKLDGGSPKLLASADDQHKDPDQPLPLLGGDPFPTISAGKVWWWSAQEQADGTFTSVIMSVPLGGGPPTQLLDNGVDVSPVDNGTVALEIKDAPAPDSSEEAPSPASLKLIDTNGTVTDLVHYSHDPYRDSLIQAMASDRDTIALSLGTEINILRTDATPIARIPLQPEQQVTEIAVCGTKVLFTPTNPVETAGQLFIFDTADKSLGALRIQQPQPYVTCSDKRLAWTTLENDWVVDHIADW